METSTSLEEDYIPVISRFMSASVEHNIQTYILELVHDQLTRRQPLDSITRNLFKTADGHLWLQSDQAVDFSEAGDVVTEPKADSASSGAAHVSCTEL
ncbi:hypothetical protein OS493_003248 [Desmophyllum pertusum]|uniref:Uncharacterized protein n=1 Tax=Desmophyllum pertusum TaxID=174260 RepID=A0A9W9YH57_9CNID|nr:hypothetical protein OS493_003248 [Desmophyllum pertusum]